MDYTVFIFSLLHFNLSLCSVGVPVELVVYMCHFGRVCVKVMLSKEEEAVYLDGCRCIVRVRWRRVMRKLTC